MSIIVDEKITEKVAEQLSEGRLDKSLNYFMSVYGGKLFAIFMAAFTLISTKVITNDELGGLFSDVLSIAAGILAIVLLYLYQRSQKNYARKDIVNGTLKEEIILLRKEMVIISELPLKVELQMRKHYAEQEERLVTDLTDKFEGTLQAYTDQINTLVSQIVLERD